MDNNPYVQLAINTYDNLGRVTQKKRHSYNQPDIENFEYNIKSQLTKITSGNTFVENISYAGLYNGNISSITFPTHTYTYSYDELNRLTNATTQNGYNEHFTYDKHGNIETLKRKSNNILIDDLVMNYDGNQLINIQEFADNHSLTNISTLKEYIQKGDGTFEYDGNGNLIKDSDREILSIEYNLLNLPSKILFENGNVIENIYAADGRKLSSYYTLQVTQNREPLERVAIITKQKPTTIQEIEGTHYIGNFEYLFDVDNSEETVTTTRIHNAEGYYEDGDFLYYRKDHLGSNREVWNATKNKTEQTNNYYASGLSWAETGILKKTTNTQPYKHAGKEFIEMGYDVYDLGFRTYYPAIGRFTSIDPLAEGFHRQSPYVYAANNPVRYIDFLGLAATTPPTDLTHGNNDIFIDGGIFGDGTGSFNPFMNGCGLPIYNGFFNFDRFGKFIPPMLNLTVVNSSGKILYHDPNAKKADGSYDDRILVASDGWKKSDGFDGLQQIGTERAGNKYKKGTYLDQYSYDYIDNEGNECTMLASAIAFAISGYGQIRVHVDQKGGYIINPGGNWGKGIFWGFAEKVFGWFNFNVAIGRFRPSIAGEVLQVPNIFLNMGQNIGGEVQQMMSEPDMIRTNLKFYFDRQHYYFDKYVFDTIIPATDTLKSNIIKNVTDHRPAGVVIYNVYPE